MNFVDRAGRPFLHPDTAPRPFSFARRYISELQPGPVRADAALTCQSSRSRALWGGQTA